MTIRYLFFSNETLQGFYDYPTVDVLYGHCMVSVHLTVLLLECIYIFWAMYVNPYIFDEMALVPPQSPVDTACKICQFSILPFLITEVFITNIIKIWTLPKKRLPLCQKLHILMGQLHNLPPPHPCQNSLHPCQSAPALFVFFWVAL